MLHLVFCDNGLERIKDTLRPNDQVVQFSSEQILLVDTKQYLACVGKDSSVEGEIIDQSRLASIISAAPAIKTTY